MNVDEIYEKLMQAKRARLTYVVLTISDVEELIDDLTKTKAELLSMRGNSEHEARQKS